MAGKKTDIDKNVGEEFDDGPTPRKTFKLKPDKTPAFNSVIPPKANKNHAPKTSAKARKGISRASAMFLALVATLAGGTIGWLGPTMFKNTGVTDALGQTVQTLQADLKSETSKRVALEATLKAAKQKNAQNTKQLLEDVFAQKQQLKSLLERNNDADIAKLRSRLDAQEALSGQSTEEGEVSVGAQALLERITAMETQITDLQAEAEAQTITPEFPVSEFPVPSAEPIKLPVTQSQETLSPQDRVDMLAVLVDSFPRTEMLAAVSAQNKIASKKPSWLQRTLSRHVKVRDDNTPALATINAAETALATGDIEEALAQIKKLNPPVRVIAKEWVIAATQAQKTLNSPTNSEER